MARPAGKVAMTANERQRKWRGRLRQRKIVNAFSLVAKAAADRDDLVVRVNQQFIDLGCDLLLVRKSSR